MVEFSAPMMQLGSRLIRPMLLKLWGVSGGRDTGLEPAYVLLFRTLQSDGDDNLEQLLSFRLTC